MEAFQFFLFILTDQPGICLEIFRDKLIINAHFHSGTVLTPEPPTTYAPYPAVSEFPVNCTFENDQCQWVVPPASSFSWTRERGVNSNGTLTGHGPGFDHTANDKCKQKKFISSIAWM